MFAIHAVFQALSRTLLSAWRVALGAALVVFTVSSPTMGYAQQTMNAPALTSEGIALTADELGPEWSLAEHQTRPFEEGTSLYDVRYSAASGRVVRLTTAVTSSPQLAEGAYERRSRVARKWEDQQCLQQRANLTRFLMELPPDGGRTTRKEGVLRWHEGEDRLSECRVWNRGIVEHPSELAQRRLEGARHT